MSDELTETQDLAKSFFTSEITTMEQDEQERRQRL